jgi:lipopolysaccharide transport system ATP-binding protein
MFSDDVAIRVRDISKCYLMFDRSQDRLKQSIVPRLQRLAGQEPSRFFREFWALRDISFDVRKGQTLGIVGRNGSGKSTLLQLICGTLTPTQGTIDVKGRVAALLELGSGFNPEFTGRENVYLNGSILGLTREQIDARFDAILAFADIGDFVDQQVKTYSSGMMMRLAFAVIANVDADILVIDEALGVGDAFFAQKCMRFLRKFKENGTILFVSHDAGAVVNFCDHAVWLNRGQMAFSGAPKDVMETYLRAGLQDAYGSSVALEPVGNQDTGDDDVPPEDTYTAPEKDAQPSRIRIVDNLTASTGWKTGRAEIESVKIVDRTGATPVSFAGGERVTLIVRARAHGDMTSPILGFYVKDRLGQELFGENTFPYVASALTVGDGQSCEARFKFVMPMLPNGDYSLAVSIAEGTVVEHVQHHWLHDALLIKVASGRPRYGLVGIPFDSVAMEVLS